MSDVSSSASSLEKSYPFWFQLMICLEVPRTCSQRGGKDMQSKYMLGLWITVVEDFLFSIDLCSSFHQYIHLQLKENFNQICFDFSFSFRFQIMSILSYEWIQSGSWSWYFWASMDIYQVNIWCSRSSVGAMHTLWIVT